MHSQVSPHLAGHVRRLGDPAHTGCTHTHAHTHHAHTPHHIFAPGSLLHPVKQDPQVLLLLCTLCLQEPCVLFATPGMLHGGTSLEVFKAWAPEPKNLVLLPSYQVGAVPQTVHACCL